MKLRPIFLVTATFAMPALLAFSQESGPAQTRMLRRTARLVEVSVVAQDAQGKAVTDLRREDFEVLDENKPQDISLFIVDSRSIQPVPALPQAKNTFTNRLEQRGSIPTSVSIVMLDALNTRKADMSYATDQVLRFIASMRRDDRIAIYGLTQSLYRLHDFSDDPVRLQRAVQRYKGGGAWEREDSNPSRPVVIDNPGTGAEGFYREMVMWLDMVQAREANYIITDRVRRTSAALETIGLRVASIPGRKNLIWVSSGFPLTYGQNAEGNTFILSPERMNFYTEVERSTRVLNSAGLVIYPVEARGVFDAYSQNPALNSTISNPFRGGQLNTPNTAADTSDRDVMIMLAERTGGKAFYNTNDLAGAIRKAVDDSAGSYTLGYYPEHGEWFSQWRKIKVRVKRQGVKLRHRPGYYAMPDSSPGKAARANLVLAAASSPLEATALGLTARAEFLNEARSGLKILIEVDPKGLQLQRGEGNRFAGTFDVSFTQFSDSGQRLRYLTQTVDMKLSSKTFTAMHRDGLEIERKLELVQGVTEVRVAVRDAATGLTGSVNIPLRLVEPGSATAKPEQKN
jgi:VWFA-related protein